MPHKIWAVGEEVLAADFQDYLQDQTVARFADFEAGSAGYTNPSPGAQFVIPNGTVYTFTNGSWRTVPARGRTIVTLDGTGQAFITHGLGMLPTGMLATAGTHVMMIFTDTPTTTTFRVRCSNAAGPVINVASAINWMVWP